MSVFIWSCRVQRVNPSWVPQDLLVLRASLEPLGSDDLVPEGPLALLDHQELHLHMDQVCVCEGERDVDFTLYP